MTKRKIYLADTPDYPIPSRAVYFNGAVWKPINDNTIFSIGDLVKCRANKDILLVGNENWTKVFKGI